MFWIRYLGFVLLLVLSCNSQKMKPKTLAIYPSSDSLPENLLRFYVQFSHPMKTVGNLENIKVLDGNGQVVEGAIFSNVHELWDDQQQQLTLILDPARVKSGLRANERFGRSLISGHAYRLVIDDMETVKHQKVKPFEKKFHVVALDTMAPNIGEWDLMLPNAKSKSPIRITFAASVDLMSLYHRLTILNDQGLEIKGRIGKGIKEKQWMFTPIDNWEEGNYMIHVNTRFADPSGNNLNGLFDHKIGSLKYEREGKTIKIPFKL